MKSNRRQNQQAAKQARKKSILNASGTSNYGKKKAWLKKHNKKGWEKELLVLPAEKKPWKVA